MKAVIPAAGLGTRFLPLTKEQPKEMLPVVDRPAIYRVAEEGLKGADGCLLQADWPQFSELQADAFASRMKTTIVADGRRILDPARMEGVRFRRIGSP